MYAIVGSKSAQILMRQSDFKVYAEDFVGRKLFNAINNELEH